MVSPPGRFFRCACAAAAFAAAAAGLHRAFPPEVEEVTPKLRFLAKNPFDTVFIGSSRVNHGIDPRLFDGAMAAGGLPVHSFNLGVDGMMPPESLHMVREVVAMNPPGLRRIFLELAESRGVPHPAVPTIRDLYWQDARALRFAGEQAWQDFTTGKASRRWAHAWGDLGDGAALFARNECNAGRFASGWGTMKASAAAVLGPVGDGYLPVDHTMSAAERQRLDEALAQVRESRVNSGREDALNRQGYAEIHELLDRRGIELILLTTPGTTRELGAKLDRPPGVPLLAFDDPGLHPELYRPDRRFDYDHLNDAGAQIFSRELAQAYLAAGSPPGSGR